ncbi:hypothetical protein C8R47DRAFT_515756 [Mycena vitilis]|nr:hypothetical protein C8R47DRAFT_515756 [Mycena vitilis]
MEREGLDERGVWCDTQPSRLCIISSLGEARRRGPTRTPPCISLPSAIIDVPSQPRSLRPTEQNACCNASAGTTFKSHNPPRRPDPSSQTSGPHSRPRPPSAQHTCISPARLRACAPVSPQILKERPKHGSRSCACAGIPRLKSQNALRALNLAERPQPTIATSPRIPCSSTCRASASGCSGARPLRAHLGLPFYPLSGTQFWVRSSDSAPSGHRGLHAPPIAVSSIGGDPPGDPVGECEAEGSVLWADVLLSGNHIHHSPFARGHARYEPCAALHRRDLCAPPARYVYCIAGNLRLRRCLKPPQDAELYTYRTTLASPERRHQPLRPARRPPRASQRHARHQQRRVCTQAGAVQILPLSHPSCRIGQRRRRVRTQVGAARGTSCPCS